MVEGNQQAESTAHLLQFLSQKGLKPVSIKIVKDSESSGKAKLFGKKITLTDQIFLAKYLSIMLKVGTDLFQAINILIADFDKPALRALLIEIRENLERGQPFYSVFEKYSDYFSPVFVNLVRSGESSGNLQEVFFDLSDTLAKEKDLRAKIKGALIYPIILLTLSMGILIFLVTFALPKLANVFTGGGFEPPAFSRAVFAVGLFINANLWLLIGLSIGLSIGLVIFFKSRAGKKFFLRFRTKVPVIKTIVFRLAIQRFASTLAALLKAGVPIMEALQITANTVSHPDVKNGIHRAREKISQGVSLGDAFKQEAAFPFVVSNLISISEKAGHIEEVLETLSKFYESEIDSSIKSAVSFIEPVLLLGIGSVIGLIALAIIVPVYQLVGQL